MHNNHGQTELFCVDLMSPFKATFPRHLASILPGTLRSDVLVMGFYSRSNQTNFLLAIKDTIKTWLSNGCIYIYGLLMMKTSCFLVAVQPSGFHRVAEPW